MAYSIIHLDEQDQYVENTGLQGLQGLADHLENVRTPYRVVWNYRGNLEPLDALERIELKRLIQEVREASKLKPKCEKCFETLESLDGVSFCVGC